MFANGLWNPDVGEIPEIPDFSVLDGYPKDVFQVLDIVRKLICELTSRCDRPESGTSAPSPIQLPGESCKDGDEDCATLTTLALPELCTADPFEPGVVSISSLGGDSLELSNTPAMPAATFTATLGDFDSTECQVASYVWTASLESRMVGSSRSHPPADQDPYRHEFAATSVPSGNDSSNPPSNSWTIPWGDLISGGTLKVRVTVNFLIYNRMTDTVTVGHDLEVVGKHEYLTTQIKTITGGSLEKLAVAWQESHHYQFDISGNPRLGGGNGWGIMQLDNIPGVTLMEPHFWDWRANVREGAKYMDETYTSAKNWLVGRRKAVNLDSDPSNDWPEDTWDPNKDELSSVKENIWNDVFSRYNTGWHLYAPNGNSGIENCNQQRPGEDMRIVDGNKNEVFDGCDYKLAIRCHLDNKIWEQPDNRELDYKCRESTRTQSSENTNE